MKNNHPKIIHILTQVVVCAGIAALLAVFWTYARYTVNIPYPDDYILGLEYLLKFDNAHSVAEQLGLMFHRFSSHILFSLALTNLIDWKLFGMLNFRHVIFVAFIFLLIATAVLQSQCKGRDKNLHALTVALLCINALTYGTTLLPNNSMLNYPVLALIGSALLLLSKPGYVRLCFAATMVTLATFSAGNGMFGFVAGAAMLALRREKKSLLLWSVWGLLIVGIFFQIFESHKEYKLATGLQLSVESLIVYYLTFLGSIAQVIPYYGSRAAPFLGVVLLAVCLFVLMYKKYYQQNAFISAWILFMLITGAVVAVGRGGNSFSDALAPRYTINACVLVALLYVALIELYERHIKRTHATAFCLLAVLFNVAALAVALPAITEKKARLTAAAERYVTRADISGFSSKQPELNQTILERAADRNIYNMATAIGLEAPYKVPPAKILGVVLPEEN